MKNKSYVYANTCVYNLNYHIVWCVKYRCKALTKEIESYLVNDIFSIGKNKGFSVIDAKVGNGDHVHIFVSVPPKYAIAVVVFWLKGSTARHLFCAFPELRKKLRHGNLWNSSYFVESIGSTSEENILRYIKNQDNPL